jgi:hypothetical protein
MELTGTENQVHEGDAVPLDDLPDEGTKPFEGDNAIDDAVAELGRRREAQARERPRAEESEEEDPTLTKVRWVDGRDPNKPITAAEAARDYGLYRDNLARQILEGTQADFDAKQAEEAQAAEPEAIQQAQERTAEEQWNSYVEGLTPEGRAQLTAAVEYQQKAQATEQTALVYEHALVDLIGRLTGSGQWNDVQTIADAERLRVQDPNRFAQLQQHVATVQNVQAEALKVHQQRQAQAQAQHQEGYRAYAAQQDKLVEAAIPELSPTADRETQRRLKEAAREVLTEAGFSENELYSAWVHGQPLYLRDHRSQRIVSDAARWRMATSREARNDLRAKRVHTGGPVQRPGVSAGNYDFHDERNLSARLRATGSVEDAVRLYRARSGRN